MQAAKHDSSPIADQGQMSVWEEQLPKNLKCSAILLLAASLSACGGAAGGCSGIELETRPYRGTGTFDFAVRNTSDEPKLVTVGFTRGGSSQTTENSFRVDAKDVEERSVGPMRQEAREGGSIELIRCE